MTTRLCLETSIRESPKETMGTPLWSDALNEYLAAAILAYGTTFPRRATLAEFSNQLLPGAALREGLLELTDRHQRP